ncbi:MAG: NAD(P)H-hydrate dehydratase, partial [Chitinophagaceae bacterium]
AMLIGGSHGMMGAVVLASKAAARVGCGKVKALIPECGYSIFQTSIPEAMCLTSGQDFIEEIVVGKGISAIGIGPGIGTEPATVKVLGEFLNGNQMPIVVDADALNILSEHQEWLSLLPENAILTPHPKEFERLFGKTKSSCERNMLAMKMAKDLGIIIVAKDTHTMIALPNGQCFFNLNGNAGLATGGTGDVLCGMITGFLAQGYSASDAALLGVFLHGAAGDAAAKEFGQEAMLAGGVVACIGNAFLLLSHS